MREQEIQRLMFLYGLTREQAEARLSQNESLSDSNGLDIGTIREGTEFLDLNPTTPNFNKPIIIDSSLDFTKGAADQSYLDNIIIGDIDKVPDYTDPSKQKTDRERLLQEYSSLFNIGRYDGYLGARTGFNFGRALTTGNPFTIGVAGLGAGLTGARNILSGVGYGRMTQKSSDEIMGNYNKALRGNYTPNRWYGEDGGETTPALVFPHVGQQIRGSLNEVFGTHFNDGGQLTFNSMDEVKHVQSMLVNLGYLEGYKEIDGYAGKKTIAALKKFQKDNQVKGSIKKSGEGDGVLGKYTSEALYNAFEEKNKNTKSKGDNKPSTQKQKSEGLSLENLSYEQKDTLRQYMNLRNRYDARKRADMWKSFRGAEVDTREVDSFWEQQQALYNEMSPELYGFYEKNVRRVPNKNFPQFSEEIIPNISFYRHGGAFFDNLSGLPKTEKLATGEFLFGIPDSLNLEYNAEVEDGEYVKHPTQDVQKVVGEKHENGGVKVSLDGGTKVLSDNLKIGKDLSKKISIFDVKSKKSDTYSDVLDKFSKNIGLDLLTSDQEKTFKKLEEQNEVKDESTRNINTQFLSKRIFDLEERRSFLEPQRVVVFDELYEAQEDFKDTEEYQKILDKEIKKRKEEEDKKVKELLKYKKSII